MNVNTEIKSKNSHKKVNLMTVKASATIGAKEDKEFTFVMPDSLGKGYSLVCVEPVTIDKRITIDGIMIGNIRHLGGEGPNLERYCLSGSIYCRIEAPEGIHVYCLAKNEGAISIDYEVLFYFAEDILPL